MDDSAAPCNSLRPRGVVAPTVGAELDEAAARSPMQGGHVLQ